jgi:hypothetical protein
MSAQIGAAPARLGIFECQLAGGGSANSEHIRDGRFSGHCSRARASRSPAISVQRERQLSVAVWLAPTRVPAGRLQALGVRFGDKQLLARLEAQARFSPKPGRARQPAKPKRYLCNVTAWSGARRLTGGHRRARSWAIASAGRADVIVVQRAARALRHTLGIGGPSSASQSRWNRVSGRASEPKSRAAKQESNRG